MTSVELPWHPLLDRALGTRVGSFDDARTEFLRTKCGRSADAETTVVGIRGTG